MTDTQALRDIIQKRGLKYYAVAEKLGITPYSLQKKIDNVTEFRPSEIVRLAQVLDISKDSVNRIFFAMK